MHISEKIKARCATCIYDTKVGREVRCHYWTHPGYVGGCGTEWALRCKDYIRKKEQKNEIPR